MTNFTPETELDELRAMLCDEIFRDTQAHNLTTTVDEVPPCTNSKGYAPPLSPLFEWLGAELRVENTAS